MQNSQNLQGALLQLKNNMENFTSIINTLWSILTIIAQILSVALLVSIFVPKFKDTVFSRFFGTHGLAIAFIVSLCALVGSLIYSDILGYTPCKLCWFQRIFIYPETILLGMALWRKDFGIQIYGIVLASIGGLIAVFHYVGQLGFNPFGLECLVIGYSASCAKNFVLQFGYITIPLMAVSACVLIVCSLWMSHRKELSVGKILNNNS